MATTENIKLLQDADREEVRQEIVDVDRIRMHPTSANRLPVAPSMLEKRVRSMSLCCHCKSQSVTLPYDLNHQSPLSLTATRVVKLLWGLESQMYPLSSPDSTARQRRCSTSQQFKQNAGNHGWRPVAALRPVRSAYGGWKASKERRGWKIDDTCRQFCRAFRIGQEDRTTHRLSL